MVLHNLKLIYDLVLQYRLPWGPPCHQNSPVSVAFSVFHYTVKCSNINVMTLQEPLSSKVRLQVSTFRNTLKTIQPLGFSPGDGFSPLGSTICSPVHCFSHCWLSWQHLSWPARIQHRYPWLRQQEGLVGLSENLLPFIAANVWRSFYSTKEWIFELYLQMVFFKLSRVHQQAGICGNSAQGINSGFGCHFDGIWIRGIVKVFNVLAMKLSVEMLSVTRGWECLRECLCRSKVMEFCYPIYEATLYHLLMKPLKY